MSGVRIVPASELAWDQVEAVFDSAAEPRKCNCQWFRYTAREVRAMPPDARRALLRDQVECARDGAPDPGLIMLVDGEPAGWVGLAPRTEFVHLRTQSTPWLGRIEDKDDPGVWVISCFVVRAPFRGERLSYALAEAARDYAIERGARAVEGYPMVTGHGEITWGELYVGPLNAFLAAGFSIVSSPSKRRRVVRYEAP